MLPPGWPEQLLTADGTVATRVGHLCDLCVSSLDLSGAFGYPQIIDVADGDHAAALANLEHQGVGGDEHDRINGKRRGRPYAVYHVPALDLWPTCPGRDDEPA